VPTAAMITTVSFGSGRVPDSSIKIDMFFIDYFPGSDLGIP